MANHVFRNGAGTWVFTTAANWDSGSVPAAADNWSVATDIGAGTIAGWSHTDRKFGNVLIPPGCNVQLGTSGSPGIFTATTIEHYGNAPFYFRSGTGTADITNRIIVRSPLMGDLEQASASSGQYAMILDDDGTSTISWVECIGGGVYLTGAAGTIGKVQVKGANARLRTDTSGIGTFTSLDVIAGWARTWNTLTNAIVGGSGMLTIEEGSVTTKLAITAGGAKVIYKADDTLAYAMVLAGELDLTRDPRFRTVTLLETGPDARVYKANNVTITTDSSLPGTVISRAMVA